MHDFTMRMVLVGRVLFNKKYLVVFAHLLVIMKQFLANREIN